MSESGLRGYIAVTDEDWFEFLRKQKNLDEVNFWQPSGHQRFKAIQPGQPFLFKLHYPINKIVGGGFFSNASLLPCSLAWEAFGIKNGAESFSEMRSLIDKKRSTIPSLKEDYTIGCIILLNPFFFDKNEWIQSPRDFHRSIVQGKTYDFSVLPGKEIWEAVQSRLNYSPFQKPIAAEREKPVFGEPISIRQRLGQGAFRVLITDIYERRCSVTGEKALPVLEAAHIRPVSEKGNHQVKNGILLRADIHRLLDRGYVTITPKYEFLVSQKIKKDFHNGELYYPLHGKELWIPRNSDDRPDKTILEWHNDTKYLG